MVNSESAPLSRKPGDFPGDPVVKTSLSNAGDAGLVPGQGDKIPQALWSKKNLRKQKQYCNKFNKDFQKWTTSKKKKNLNQKEKKKRKPGMELKGFQCYFLAWKKNPPWSFKLLSMLWILTQWPLLCVFQTLGFPYITFSFLDLFLRRRLECSVAFLSSRNLPSAPWRESALSSQQT